MLDATPVMLRWIDEDGVGLYFNAAWGAFTGQEAGTHGAGGWQDCMHPEDSAIWQQAFREAAADGRRFATSYRLRRADGQWRRVADSAAPVAAPAGRGYVLVTIDITEASAREERARRDLGLYHALAEAIPALVITMSPDGDVEYANARLRTYCGTDVEGLSGARWADYIHPDDVRTGREGWQRRVARLEPFSSEYRIRRHDGSYRWHLTHTAPLRDARGTVQAWIGASVDVHERHEAERMVIEVAEDLRRAQEAKDEFLGLISHELRTPITTIYGNAQVLRRMGEKLDPADVREAITDVEAEAIRLQQLVDNMFVLARLEGDAHLPTEPLLLGRAVARVVGEHRSRHPERTVEMEDHTGSVPIRGAPVYVEQILRNLLSNAEKYSPADGTIRVVMERAGDTGIVRIIDTGMGMSSDEEALVFDTFYRSRDAQARAQGAGIGLTVARRLAEAQGGSVSVQQRGTAGTEARLVLPLEKEETI